MNNTRKGWYHNLPEDLKEEFDGIFEIAPTGNITEVMLVRADSDEPEEEDVSEGE